MSGYGERRSFETHPGEGGVESEYLGLPFKSTPCEDWYGFGDSRCPNRYNETGDLEIDIISLKKWIGLYGGHGRTSWKVWASNELERKQSELKKNEELELARPPRVSVFVEPPPEVVTVAPPGYVKPEKPPRVSVFDPSTVSSFTPFGDLTLSQLVMDYYPLPEAVAEQEITLPSIYGAQYVPGVEPVPFTPMVVEYATSEREPIPITTDQVEPPIEPEPEVTTADVEPPIEPEVITADLEEAPTEERPVKWIPEPFFSFINEVFSR